jgi:iron(III) transport system substrate-binding protein
MTNRSNPGSAVSRRQFLLDSAAVMAAGSGLMSIGSVAEAQAGNEALYAAAKKEGKLTWWCGFLDRPTMQLMVDAFTATYPGIAVDALWQTGEVTYTRLQQNLKAGVDEVDVVITPNAGHWPVLKAQGALTAYQTRTDKVLSPMFKNIDADHAYRAGGVEVVVIAYRSDKGLVPPAKWTDMLDAKWNNKLTCGSPAFSGDVACWTIAMLDQYGVKFIKEMAKLNPKIGRSVLGAGIDINSGERLVGPAQDANTFSLKAAGNPIDGKFPDDGAILALGYTGILKKARNPNAAKLFMEFTDSKRYSEVLVKGYGFPLRSDVPTFNGVSLDKIKTYRSTVERLVSGRPEAVAAWQAAFGI